MYRHWQPFEKFGLSVEKIALDISSAKKIISFVKLFSKGPKYREPEQIDWGSARETVKPGIEDFIKNLSETKHVAVNYFQNWKFSLLELVDNKI